MKIEDHVLVDIIFQYRKLKEQTERALTQVNDKQFFMKLDDEANSIAILLKHIAGNMKSRWTDFLTTDGEKSFRDRPAEFEQFSDHTRSEYMQMWDESWEVLFNTVSVLIGDDLIRTITIRKEEHTVVEALHRQLTHYAAHIGQIVLLAKHWNAENWNTLSIPRDQKRFSGGSYKKQ